MRSEKFLGGKVILRAGDCRKRMKEIPANSVDACIGDPPYHLQSIVKRFAKTGRTDKTRSRSGPHQRTASGFMNKKWDGGDVAFNPATWKHVFRVLKPGGYIVMFSSSRTFGRMSVAIEDAGFITHPMIAWMFGQGFPKAHRVAASGLSALDRKVEGWEGWRYGTQATKPAIEPIYVGQKPFQAGLNGWQNIQKWGVGAINIDGCRIPLSDDHRFEPGTDIHGNTIWCETCGERPATYNTGGHALLCDECHAEAIGRPAREVHARRKGVNYSGNALSGRVDGSLQSSKAVGKTKLGRWPANVVHDGSPEVVGRFPAEAGGGGRDSRGRVHQVFTDDARRSVRDDVHPGHNDEGSASRFFYTAKADSDDRLGSGHPTVKPLDLNQWLVRMFCPPGGLILDPFAGTGPIGEAAWREGMRAILIEKEDEYCRDIRRRMKLALAGPDERARESIKAKLAAKGAPLDHGPLFGGSV